jgi:outer membrane protein assembly factor BamB
VYALGDGDQKPNGQMLCVELATGRICWREKLDRAAQFTSPVVADGKIIATVGPWLYLIAATPGKYTLLGKANLRLEKWMSPAFADGLVYVRTVANVVCYDLRRRSAP